MDVSHAQHLIPLFVCPASQGISCKIIFAISVLKIVLLAHPILRACSALIRIRVREIYVFCLVIFHVQVVKLMILVPACHAFQDISMKSQAVCKMCLAIRLLLARSVQECIGFLRGNAYLVLQIASIVLIKFAASAQRGLICLEENV
jgi:hypothetical protein